MSDSLKKIMGAHRMLESMGGYEEGMVFPSAKEKVEYIEAVFPAVKFDRLETGDPIDWGLYPVQAMGYINGNPFYFKMRDGYSELSVWDSAIPLDNIPAVQVDPILVAYSEYELLPLEEIDSIACSEFISLLNSLEEPKEAKSERIAEIVKNQGIPTGREIGPLIEKAYPQLTMVHRPGKKDDGFDVLLKSNSGLHIEFDWMINLIGRVYLPEHDPQINDPISMFYHEAIDYGADANEIMSAIISITDKGVSAFQYDTAYANSFADLPISDRREWGNKIIEACDELASIFNTEKLSLAQRKEIESLMEYDDMDMFSRYFN